ncbi:MAG TPA: PepSY domain-containing protein [Stellaceae bacterium]|nr:PepSY domain-containing protein [Stellaceae bacterium]
MKGLALALFALVSAAALAHAAAAASAPAPAATTQATEPMSRAQVRQTIEDHGYFELRHLERGADGSWRCTALADAGKRVTVILNRSGGITETAVPGGDSP